jgi:hypothetical protein
MQAKTEIYIINRIFSTYTNDFPVDENRPSRTVFVEAELLVEYVASLTPKAQSLKPIRQETNFVINHIKAKLIGLIKSIRELKN